MSELSSIMGGPVGVSEFLGGVGESPTGCSWEQNHVGLVTLETRSLSLEDGISPRPHRLLLCSALSAIIWDRVYILG